MESVLSDLKKVVKIEDWDAFYVSEQDDFVRVYSYLKDRVFIAV